jgi:enoyl-CoA hydratase
MTPHLTVTGRRAVVVLDAPERRNALGPEDLRELVRIAAEIDRDEGIDVAIVRANGTTFCAGYDLRALGGELAADEPSPAQADFARAIDAIERLRVPTICVLNGGAHGGGADLALACDIRIGTARATLAVPAARFGLQFYYSGLRRSVERLGIDVAKRLFLLGESIEATELREIGFLAKLVAETDLEASVEDVSERLLANAPSAVRGLKRSLDAIERGTARAESVDDAFAFSFGQPDTARRLREGRKGS